jgi:hypothetical protein
VLWKLPKREKLAKMKQRWEYGVFVGVRRRSGEFWVVDKEGKVQAVRSIRRVPVEERWGKDTRRWVKGVPWHKYKGDEYQDREMPEGVEVEEPEEETEETQGEGRGGEGEAGIRVEESPKQSSGSNGVVERAVQEVEGQMRAILIAVEQRIG